MSAYSRGFLSAAANGNLIQITPTATPGTTVHTAVASTSQIDEVWLYATNTSASSVDVTVEWGGTGIANNIIITVPAKTTMPLIEAGNINNSQIIGVFAGTTNVVNVYGYVDQVR